MAYIPADQVHFGNAGEAPPMSLIIDTVNANTLLTIAAHVVFLEGEWRGDAAEARKVEHFSGALITGLTVEVDHSSAFDPAQNARSPLLSLVRRDTALFVEGLQRERGAFGDRHILCPIVEELPKCPVGAAGFTRWRLVLGKGVDRVVVHEVDSQPA